MACSVSPFSRRSIASCRWLSISDLRPTQMLAIVQKRSLVSQHSVARVTAASMANARVRPAESAVGG